MSSDLKKELESIEKEYIAPTPDRVVDQKFVDLIARYVVSRLPGNDLLELGVGDQIWTRYLVDKFKTVTTVDASEQLLKIIGETMKGKNWTPVTSFFEDYEPEIRYDTVLATYVLEHVDDPGLVLRLAREKWLKEGGRIAVVVPHALSLHRRLSVEMGMSLHPAQLGETDHRMGHKHCFTCFEMEKLIVAAGFKIVESSGLICKVLPNAMLAQCNDAQLEGLFKLGLSLPIEYSGAIYFQAETR